MIKRVLILLVVVGSLLGILMLFSYDVIKLEWITFMEIQPSYKPMDDPLPVAEGSIPVEGAAYIPGMGAPANPDPCGRCLRFEWIPALLHQLRSMPWCSG